MLGGRFFLYFHCTLNPTNWGLAITPLFNFEFGHHTCLSNNSLISSLISTKLVSMFVLCMLYKSNNFQAKANTLTYLRVNFTQQVESSRNPCPLSVVLHETLESYATLTHWRRKLSTTGGHKKLTGDICMEKNYISME